MGVYECSTEGIRGLAGCECTFFGACDAHGTKRAGLNITHHLPTGLELFGYVEKASRNLAYLCEDRTVAILYDCNSRIPLYAATVIDGSQFSAADQVRPKKNFRLSQTGLHEDFQQSNYDYLKATKRTICYKRRKKPEVIDEKWYRAKNSNKRPLTKDCVGGLDKLKVTIHRGHMIASQYGRGDQARKKATFVYTNAVPQFGNFNSIPWQICERKLVVWGQNNCARNGAAKNVQMFIVVGAIPSTFSEARYFGENGFSDYQDRKYRVNVPKEMWTAACCTFEYKDGRTWRTATKSTAFWRENVPGILPCNRLDKMDTLVRWLKGRKVTQINLFPYSNECNKMINFIQLS